MPRYSGYSSAKHLYHILAFTRGTFCKAGHNGENIPFPNEKQYALDRPSMPYPPVEIFHAEFYTRLGSTYTCLVVLFIVDAIPYP